MQTIMREILLEVHSEEIPNMTLELYAIVLLQGNEIIKFIESHFTGNQWLSE